MRLLIKKSNKGAALVSIMVAVAFLSIIATTLLAISLNNYEMKSVQTKSNMNFYNNEKYLNVVTTNLRSSVYEQTDPKAVLAAAVGGDFSSGTSTVYKASKLADIIQPGTTHSGDSSCTLTIDGVEFTISGGVLKDDTPADVNKGSKIVMKDVTFTAKDSEGFKSTIKTDIEFYMKSEPSVKVNSGLGDCSFLLDNQLKITSSDQVRIQIYGNGIFGKYKQDPSNSSKSIGDQVVVLNNIGDVNVLGDYSVFYGDIVLNNNSIFYVAKGNVSVFGNIYINGSAAFICNGSLKLGPNSKVYYQGSEITIPQGTPEKKADGTDETDDNKKIYKISAASVSNKSKNFVITKDVYRLSKEKEENIRNILRLNSGGQTDDGVLKNIIQKQGGKYFYEYFDNQDSASFYVDGQSYKAQIYKESNIQNQSEVGNRLMMLSSGITEYNLNTIAKETTFLSLSPINCAQTHSITLTQLGNKQFHTLLNGNYKVGNDNNKVVKNWFISDPDSVINSIFENSVESMSSDDKCTDTAAGYSNWTKE